MKSRRNKHNLTRIGLCAALFLTQGLPALASMDGQQVSSAVEAASLDSQQSISVQTEERINMDNVKISKSQAIELARQYVEIPQDYEQESIHLNSNSWWDDNSRYWQISYVKKSDDEWLGSISVTIDAENGSLLNYHAYDYEQESSNTYPPKVDMQEAYKIAEEFIQKINPEVAGLIRFDEEAAASYKTPLQGNVEYPLTFYRVVNDIPFPNNYIRVRINGDGDITSYDYHWNDQLTFTEPSEMISEDKAREIFNKYEPYLQYLTPYQSTENQVFLSYDLSYPRIDGVTGEPLDQNEVSLTENKQPITEKPLAAIPDGSLNLTQQQAIETVHELVTLPDNAELEKAAYFENSGTNSTDAYWTLQWNVDINQDENLKGSIYARVDSTTGELMNYSRYDNVTVAEANAEQEQTSDEILSQEEAEAIAVDFIKKSLPYYTDQLVLRNTELADDEWKKLNEYRISFIRIIDEVQVQGEGATITIDASSGEIISFHHQISDQNYPNTQPEAISIMDAKEKLSSLYELKLRYEWTPQPEFSVYNDFSEDRIKLMIASGQLSPDILQAKNDVAKPVYYMERKPLEESVFLDASEGVWRNRETGETTSIIKQEATDIQDHWAYPELSIMLEYHALDIKDGKVYPDQAITRGEMIKMLVISIRGGSVPYYDKSTTASFADVSYGSKYFAYVESALDMNLLDQSDKEFRPDDTISREELAKLIVKALGYSKLADVNELFSTQAADEDQIDYPGHVAIVRALGIMSLDENGEFRPG